MAFWYLKRYLAQAIRVTNTIIQTNRSHFGRKETIAVKSNCVVFNFLYVQSSWGHKDHSRFDAFFQMCTLMDEGQVLDSNWSGLESQVSQLLALWVGQVIWSFSASLSLFVKLK